MMTGHARGSGKMFSPETRARALAVILSEEFKVPFTFYEAASGREIFRPEANEGRPRGPQLGPELVTRLAQEGRNLVAGPVQGCYQLALVVFEAGRAVLVAAGTLPGLAVAGSDGGREREWLEKWLQAVGDRLRLRDQLAEQRRGEEEQAEQARRAWEVILGVDDAVRRLRIHRDPDRSRQGILKTAHALLDVQALLWVPQQAGAQVLTQGEPCLAAADSRELADLLARNAVPSSGRPVVWNQEESGLWLARFPHVANLLAIPVNDQHQAGWVIAVNKRAPTAGQAAPPFRRADAAALLPFAALLQLQVRSARRYHDLKELLVGLTRALTAALDAKDSYTFGHSERVARIAVELGRELGLPEDELSDIYLAGLLHDVGKVGIRDAVLAKPGPLTPEETEHLKQHVTIGHKILADLHPLRNLLPGVLHHHERWDGKGYPHGVAGEQIPLLARILAVADAYDAMSTHRPYREALPRARVEELLRQGAAAQWDRRVIDAFWRCRERVHLIRQRGVGESLGEAIDRALRSSNGVHPPEAARLGAGSAG